MRLARGATAALLVLPIAPSAVLNEGSASRRTAVASATGKYLNRSRDSVSRALLLPDATERLLADAVHRTVRRRSSCAPDGA